MPLEPVEASTGFDLGAAVIGRISGRTSYVSAGADAWFAVTTRAWVLGVTARYEGWQAARFVTPAEFARSTAGAGFLVARRIEATPSLGFDAGVRMFVLQDVESYDDPGEHAGVSSDVRVGGLLRALFGASPLRLTAAIDAEVSPARARRSMRIDDGFPILPSWSIGVALGVAWREL